METRASAILLLIFNRPDTTTRVFQAIREVKPLRLYIAADGPRKDKIGEREKCEEARLIASGVDWQCEVHTLFRRENLGCRRAVSEGISWFFEHESEGIILEDDCVPDLSFFDYCAALLRQYRNNEKIMVITGNNFQNSMANYDHSYYYSIYNHCWGWASWRRAWIHYDTNMQFYRSFLESDRLENLSSVPGFAKYWRHCFDGVESRRIDSWAYVWTYSCWQQGGLTCTPSVNLVSNIGFGHDATHTTNAKASVANLPITPIKLPLNAPPQVITNSSFDDYVTTTHFGIGNSIARRSLLHRIVEQMRQWL